MTLVKACSTSDIAKGGLKSVKAGGKDLVIANVDGKFFAMDNWCTHEQGNLSEGQLNKTTLTCPEHGAQFDVTTGRVLAGPDGEAPGETPTAKVHKVEVQGSNVMVDVD
jgi:nitrite reductase/ring-hydroxylating ferredoxin subunit